MTEADEFAPGGRFDDTSNPQAYEGPEMKLRDVVTNPTPNTIMRPLPEEQEIIQKADQHGSGLAVIMDKKGCLWEYSVINEGGSLYPYMATPPGGGSIFFFFYE